MGDHADELVDDMMDDPDCDWSAFRTEPTCRKCGKKHLTWYNVGEKWMLYESKGMRLVVHTCPPKDHSSAFEDES